MSPEKVSRRAWTAAVLRLTSAAGMAAIVGCGEPEATVVPSNKPREQVEKEMENPYGAEIKNTIKPKKGSRRN